MNNFNNNYNNYNNYGYNQPVYRTAETVLAEIDLAIKESVQNNGPSRINSLLDALRDSGDIIDIGTGTNRRIIKLANKYDLTNLKSRYAPSLSNKEVVFKIPYKVVEGRVDNLREAFITDALYKHHLINDDFKFLLNVLPEAYLLREPLDTTILMEEYVVPGELSQQVQNLIQRDTAVDTKGEYHDEYGNPKRATYLSKYLTTNSAAVAQLQKIIFTLDKYFVMADINPLYSPCNYGFKRMPNGDEILTILDLGYALPKERSEPTCPKCGVALKYVVPTEELVTNTGQAGTQLARKLLINGLYSCKNNNCTEGNSTVFTSYPDEAVFFNHVQALRDLWSQDPRTFSLLQYL